MNVVDPNPSCLGLREVFSTATGYNQQALFTTTLQVPCSAAGSPLTLKVTSATGDTSHYDQASATIQPDPSCLDPSCTATSTSPSSRSPGAAMPTTAASSSAVEFVNVPYPTATATAATGPGSCQPSALGYSCLHNLGGVQLHYSNAGVVPSNICTGTTHALEAQTVGSSAAPNNSSSGLVHFAAEASTHGWVSLAFASTPGKMPDSQAALAWISAAGAPFWDSYNIGGYNIAPSDAVRGWASNQGVVQTSDGRTIICFSRAAADVGGAQAQTVNMNWAVANTAALVEHQQRGAFALNLATGDVTIIDIGLAQFIVAHGVLMTLAWIVLLPAGILFARHKALLRDRQLKGSAIWFQAHRWLQILGSSLMVVGVVIAALEFPDMQGVQLYEPHKLLGWTVVALTAVQIAAAFIRPAPGAVRRGVWNAFHHNWGRVAMVLAWINIYLGMSLPYVNTAAWYIAVSVLLAVVVAAGVWLEVYTWAARRQEATAAEAKARAAHLKELEMRNAAPDSPLVADSRLEDELAGQV